eukprot:TRINITY_DN50762_c0_g1_i1.p1 TRINITY_DN50762_c0_g1~~TRINITY_DN50762_c0_g1_i1.p1  ORF type:complete len:665 (-),score=107.16 TRINITY_DN50762_c0_g1_i1:109-2103(-)
MQGLWPQEGVQSSLLDLIDRAGGNIFERGGGPAGRRLAVEFDKRLARQLLVAASSGDVGLVRVALAQSADPNSVMVGYRNASALHLACVSGSSDVVRLLLDVGASATLQDDDGVTALDAALKAGSTHCAMTLLERRIPKVMDTLDSVPSRWVGALHSVLQSCPEAPTEANKRSGRFTEVDAERLNDIERLLQEMTEPQKTETATKQAPRAQYAQFFGLAGAPPPADVVSEETVASIEDENRELAKGNLVKRIELRRALFVCVTRGWNGAAVALLRGCKGLDPNRLDPKSRRTALELAEALYLPETEPDTPEVCHLLRIHGATGQRNPHLAEWAVLLAAAQNNVRGLTYWLRKAKDVDWREPPPPANLQGGLRATALMIAATEGHTEAVLVLLQHGAQAALYDAGGRTAGQLARQRGYDKLADLLDKRATPFIERSLAERKTQEEKKEFLSSFRPPTWSPAENWREEGDNGGGEVEVFDEEPVEFYDDVVVFQVNWAKGLVSDYFQTSIDTFVKMDLMQKRPQGAVRVARATSLVIDNSNAPVWNERFEFEITPEAEENLALQVLDTDHSGLIYDTLMGRIDIKLPRWLPYMQKGKAVTIERRLQYQCRGATTGIINTTMWLRRKGAAPLSGSPEDMSILLVVGQEIVSQGEDGHEGGDKDDDVL